MLHVLRMSDNYESIVSAVDLIDVGNGKEWGFTSVAVKVDKG